MIKAKSSGTGLKLMQDAQLQITFNKDPTFSNFVY